MMNSGGCTELGNRIRTRVMRQRWMIMMAIFSCVGAATLQRGSARDSQVRQTVPADEASFSSTWSPPTDSSASAGYSRSISSPVIGLTPRSLSTLLVYPPTAPATIANSAIMIDAKTGGVLFFKNPDIPRPVARTQKLLTALLVAEHGGPDQSVRVAPADCAVEPTKLGFRPGEVYSKRQLLAAMLVHSCNDAAVCLARNDAGSVSSFATLMNAKAAALGAANSRFVNPNGLPRAGQ